VNRELGLKILAKLLDWPDSRAREEYRWLRVMSYLKYDGYQDFVAGKRFIESLISWLKQFQTPAEREAAYMFVRERLVYFGPAEIQHLVRLTYPEVIRRHLVKAIADAHDIAPHEVWTVRAAREALRQLRRQTLFVGLSDGARIDIFRRANVGILSNEQIVAMPQFDEMKWADLLADLRREMDDDTVRFAQVILLDDFVASGKSLLRPKNAAWKGKLVRFHENVVRNGSEALEPSWRLLVHHYIAAAEGKVRVELAAAQRGADTAAGPWFPSVEFSYTTVLPPALKLDPTRDAAFLDLVDRYYDPAIEDEHTGVGGDSAKLGFADGGLPLVLEHNTPNNSVALLWEESEGAGGAHRMRPLFRRRKRHL
jgi:hypothetical protein